VRRKSLRIEVLLAPDAFWHGIDQENKKKGKTDAPDPPAHAGTSALENGSLCGGLDSFFFFPEACRSRGKNALISGVGLYISLSFQPPCPPHRLRCWPHW
jgi:hypothetical protein